MILIADSGATKTHWVLLDRGKVAEEVYTKGFNPYYYEAGQFEESVLVEMKGKMPVGLIREVFFYGSGVSSTTNRSILQGILSKVFTGAVIHARHDLHAAAIALLGNSEGIACILGTGSNSCLWDGRQIVSNVPSLGYMLGDEGSGTYMGKLLVRDVLIDDADPEVTDLFYSENQLDFASTLDRIYKEADPNLFFASQSRFLRKHLDFGYCRKLIRQSFRDFVKVQLQRYNGFKKLPVSFTGSIAHNFQDLLKEVLAESNITPGKIMKEPMEGLIEFHAGR